MVERQTVTLKVVSSILTTHLIFWNKIYKKNKNEIIEKILLSSKIINKKLNLIKKKEDKLLSNSYYVEEQAKNSIIDNNAENWKTYKKKTNFLIIRKKKQKQIKAVLFFQNNTNIFKFFKNNIKNYLKMVDFFQKNYNFLYLIKFYNLINFLKINNNHNKLKYFNYYFIIKFLKNKTKIYINNNFKCIYSLTPGILMKKLQIKTKNIKKSEKIANLSIKSATKSILEKKIKGNIIVNLKKIDSKNYKSVSIISKFLKKNELKFKISFIFTPNMIITRVKFKKIKSIKRKFVKKFIKNS